MNTPLFPAAPLLPFGLAASVTFTGPASRDEILERTGLNRLTLIGPAFADGGPSQQRVDDWYVTRRSDTHAPFGCVRSRYTPLHNVELVDFMHALVDAADGQLDIAQSISWGAGRFVAFALNVGPERAVQVESDPHLPYLVVSNAHDGSCAARVTPFYHRLACRNQLQRRESLLTIRHTVSAHDRLRHARESIGLVWNTFDQFSADIARMIDVELSAKQETGLLAAAFPIPPSDSSRVSANVRRRDEVRYLYDNDRRVANLPLRSAYRWLQAVSTWEQHERSSTQTATATERVARTVLGEHTHTNRASVYLDRLLTR